MVCLNKDGTQMLASQMRGYAGTAGAPAVPDRALTMGSKVLRSVLRAGCWMLKTPARHAVCQLLSFKTEFRASQAAEQVRDRSRPRLQRKLGPLPFFKQPEVLLHVMTYSDVYYRA